MMRGTDIFTYILNSYISEASAHPPLVLYLHSLRIQTGLKLGVFVCF